MKKFISILLVSLISLMSVSAFAAGATRPQPLTYGGISKVNQPNAKVDTTGIKVESTVNRANDAFGEVSAIFDGVGMAGTTYNRTDNNNEVTIKEDGTTTLDNGGFNNKNRYTINANSTPVVTITFPEAKTFDVIKWTEARKMIGEYSFTFYNGNDVVGEKTGAFTDESTANNFYLRTVSLDKQIAADKIVFEVKTLLGTNAISITEMEFWRRDVLASVNTTTNTTFGDINTIFDGVGMVSVTTPAGSIELKNRWVTDIGAKPTITLEFSKDTTFNTIKWTEVRKQIKGFTVKCYKGGENVLTKSGTFTDTNTVTDLYLRSFDLGEFVTVDKIEFIVTDNAATGVLSIAEMEFCCSFPGATIKDAAGTKVDIINGYPIDKAFDGKYYDTTTATGSYRCLFTGYTKEGEYNYELPITISFDLGSPKTFNYAELAELRGLIGEIEVQTSDDGVIYNTVATMPAQPYKSGADVETIHNVRFTPVTKRYVRYIIKEMAVAGTDVDLGGSVGVTINEISLYNFPEINSEAVIYPVHAFGTAFDINAKSYINAHSNITIKNTSDSAKEYMLVGAAYDDKGILTNVYLDKVTVNAKSESTFVQYAVANKNSLKFFVWDENLVPLTEALPLEKTN